MKKKISILVVALGVLAFLTMAAQREASKETPKKTSKNTTLEIKGMTCGGCLAAVKVQLKKTEGVLSYDVSLEKAETDVSYEPDKTDPVKIAASVSKTGFTAKVKKEEEQEEEEDMAALRCCP